MKSLRTLLFIIPIEFVITILFELSVRRSVESFVVLLVGNLVMYMSRNGNELFLLDK